MKNNIFYILLFIYAVLSTFVIFYFDGTGDAGDSVFHYQFARYAPLYPKLFFDHWAKPVYVLLACPFAQFGFIGIKIFNVIVSLITILITYLVIQKLEIKNPIIGALMMMCAPLYFVLTHSGLTEPLFALFISIGIYFILKNKYIAACLIISFLPFVRSEGLIFIGVFGLYLLVKRKWKLIPLLLVGHLVYSLAGLFVYHDFLWVFNKIPYARLSSIYGSGKLSHFVVQMFYVVGAPIYILFWIGVISIIWKSIRKRISPELQILVFLGFFVFFIAHSLFWYLGIFNSMGLKRVLLGVIPLIAIIALEGFNFMAEDIFANKRILQSLSKGILITSILLFPFISNKASINWKKDFELSVSQRSSMAVADYINKNLGLNHRFIFADTNLSEALHIDHFDDTLRIDLTTDFMNQAVSGDIIIWDNWFAVVDKGVTKEFLDNNSDLINLYNLSEKDDGRDVLYSIYTRK